MDETEGVRGSDADLDGILIDVYTCERSWDAWQYDMSRHDFTPAGESEVRAELLAWRDAAVTRALGAATAGPTVIEPHDDGTSYCTSLPLHDHDRPGGTCPAYRLDDNGDRWPCIRPPVHNYPEGLAERIHVDQFGNKFRISRCQNPAAHGMPHCWCTVPGHHKPLEAEPERTARPVFEVLHADKSAAPAYLLGCGHQVIPAGGATVGGPYTCAVHGDTTVIMMIPLPAATP